MADKISQEVIVDIISRLPTKSLLRFRCVCKPWCTLIADPNFIKTHFSRAMERHSVDLLVCQTTLTYGDVKVAMRDGDGFAYNMAKALPFFQMNTDDMGYNMSTEFPSYQMHTHRVQGGSFDKAYMFINPFKASLPEVSVVIGSCNGIVCLVHFNAVCLWNPCTREYKVVEFYDEFRMDHSSFYGFGYDPSSDDYKLVQVVNSDDDDDVVNIYSVKDGSCLTIEDIPYEIETYNKELGIFLNGACHWTAYCRGEILKVAVSFDIGEKVFREVPRPADLDPRFNIALGVLGGKLSLVCQNKFRGIEIWIMKDYGVRDSWIKVITAEQCVYHSLSNVIDSRVLPKPLCFSENGEALLMVDGVLFLHGPKQETPRVLQIPGLPDTVHKTVTYVPSLVQLKSGIYLPNIPGVEGEILV